MSEEPQKRRFQFSLKILLLAMGMFAVGMGMYQPLNQGDTPEGIKFFIVMSGLFMVGATPGIVIGYGLGRLKGAVIGSLVSGLLAFPADFLLCLLTTEGL